KARENVAEIAAVERRVFVDLSREESPAQRTVRNKTDSEFFTCGDHFLLRLSPPQRIFVLNSSDWLHSMCATNGLYPGFRKPKVPDLASLYQLPHRAGDIFNRHLRINTVLIEQIDHIRFEPLQRSVGNFLDVFWATIQLAPPRIAGRSRFEPELGRDHHLLAKRSQRFAHKFLVRERAINFGGIEKCDAAFHSCPKQRDDLL